MNLFFTTHFKTNLQKFPKEARERFYKQTDFLLVNLHYPSLRAKKYDETKNIWQARVDKNIRFYFLIKNDVYILLDIKKHAK